MNATMPFTLLSFPQAILHVDGDAFFASVEQAVHPELKGKPVVTGGERNIITCASYEAKAFGVRRGVPLFKARQMCPGLVVREDDFETYGLYSKRMFGIMRRFTPAVEEYSIDEGFADLSGLRRLHRASYGEIARRIQAAIRNELGLTVSAGLSLSKSLAKLASKFRKPAGFTAVRGRHIHLFLQRAPLKKVWGFGLNTVHLLSKHGLRTAWDFAVRPEEFARNLLGKTGLEIWSELRGDAVYPVNSAEKTDYATISKSRTFAPPSGDRDFVYAELVSNLEAAFVKLRRHRLRAKSLAVMLREQDFSEAGLQAALNRPAAAAQEAMPVARMLFENIYRAGGEYRATAVTLGHISADENIQPDLFEDNVRADKMTRVSRTVDAINDRFGRHTVSFASSLFLCRNSAAASPALSRLGIPRLFIGV
jgi:DNA polymerase-4/DNA polymerase V